jgi:type I restriction enzyme S subunit
VPFIGIRNVIDGRIDWESVDKWVTRETHQALTAASPPEVGDILYTAVGATYGRAIALVDARPFVFQRHIALFKLVPAFRAQYAQYALNSPGVFAQAKLLARGAAQPTVTLGDMARFAIPLAPTAEQHAIEQAVLRAISAGETVLLQVRSAAERQREVDRALLAKAFRGDLVPQDPTDEPAAAMLARLRAPASPAEPSPTKRRARAPAT